MSTASSADCMLYMLILERGVCFRISSSLRSSPVYVLVVLLAMEPAVMLEARELRLLKKFCSVAEVDFDEKSHVVVRLFCGCVPS